MKMKWARAKYRKQAIPGPLAFFAQSKEPVMTIHSRTGTESNRRQVMCKAIQKRTYEGCKSNSGQEWLQADGEHSSGSHIAKNRPTLVVGE